MVQESLSIYEKTYSGREHPNVASTIICIGTSQSYLGRYDEPTSSLTEARTILTRKSNKECEAELLQAEGTLFRKLGNPAESKKCLENGLTIRCTELGQLETHTGVQELRFELGLTLVALNDMKTARTVLGKLLKDRQSIYPAKHIRVVEWSKP